MNTLISPLLLPLQIKEASLQQQRNPILNPKPTFSIPNAPYFTKKPWKLIPKAKGFGAAEVSPASETKRINDDNVRSRSRSDEGEDEKIPQVVWDRMIVRILTFVGTPMATGIALLYIFGVLKDQQVWDVPLWLPLVTTLIAFGTSALGIAYGTLSTSLDAEEKGSVLGWEEVQKNWPELWKEEEDESKR